MLFDDNEVALRHVEIKKVFLITVNINKICNKTKNWHK